MAVFGFGGLCFASYCCQEKQLTKKSEQSKRTTFITRSESAKDEEYQDKELSSKPETMEIMMHEIDEKNEDGKDTKEV